MGVRIGIDIGSSTTKIAAFEKDRLLEPMVVRADTQVASLYGAFGQYLYENGLDLPDVEGVYMTGVGSRYLDKQVYALPTYKVDEFVATGTGGYYLTDKKEVIVISMGTGSFFVKVTEKEMILERSRLCRERGKYPKPTCGSRTFPKRNCPAWRWT